jgi:hypothetical protein
MIVLFAANLLHEDELIQADVFILLKVGANLVRRSDAAATGVVGQVVVDLVKVGADIGHGWLVRAKISEMREAVAKVAEARQSALNGLVFILMQ